MNKSDINKKIIKVIQILQPIEKKVINKMFEKELQGKEIGKIGNIKTDKNGFLIISKNIVFEKFNIDENGILNIIEDFIKDKKKVSIAQIAKYILINTVIIENKNIKEINEKFGIEKLGILLNFLKNIITKSKFIKTKNIKGINFFIYKKLFSLSKYKDYIITNNNQLSIIESNKFLEGRNFDTKKLFKKYGDKLLKNYNIILDKDEHIKIISEEFLKNNIIISEKNIIKETGIYQPNFNFEKLNIIILSKLKKQYQLINFLEQQINIIIAYIILTNKFEIDMIYLNNMGFNLTKIQQILDNNELTIQDFIKLYIKYE